MTIYEFMMLFLDENDQRVEIINLASDDVENLGTFAGLNEIPEEYLDCEIMSIDNLYEATKTITLNIDFEC